ncbi:lipase member H-like isoform X2 [Diachasmimorpha longicaudata]
MTESSIREESIITSQGFTCPEITPDLAEALTKLQSLSKIPNQSDKINLVLHTRSEDRTIAQNGHLVDIRNSSFNPERKTVVIIHGFLTDSAPNWMGPLVAAYLVYEDVNIIIVDWSMFTVSGDYLGAASNVANTAQQAADLFGDIVKEFGDTISWQGIHMIGFSLGAHVAANIARKLHNYQKVWNISRITGLDPAGPCYQNNPWRLDKSVAPFVDVIHTNGDPNANMPFGIIEPIGHVDFYVNGGDVQPECVQLDSFLEKLIDVFLPGLSCAKCSHEKATLYFIASLELENARTVSPLLGIKWNRRDLSTALDFIYNNTCTTKCMPMGINAHNRDQDSSGIYFVPAGPEKPFNEITEYDKRIIANQLRIKI